MTSIRREFVISHFVGNFASLEKGKYYFSHLKEHYGLYWAMRFSRVKDTLQVRLETSKMQYKAPWKVKVEYEIITKLNGGVKAKFSHRHVFTSAGETRKSLSECTTALDGENQVKVEIHVLIKKSEGLPKGNLMCFDETVKEFSDVVLLVEDRKFYVLREFLASHSTYFKTLLLGNFLESRSPEVTLPNVSAADFQNFLEVLYLEPAIDENTVLGIHQLADMYDVQAVVRKCEEFLIEKSEMPLKDKLMFAMQYKLDDLKDDCLSKIETLEDVRAVLPDDPSTLDHSLAVALLEKAVVAPPSTPPVINIVTTRPKKK